MADKSSDKKQAPEQFKNQRGNQTPGTPQKKEGEHERGHRREHGHGHEKNQ